MRATIRAMCAGAALTVALSPALEARAAPIRQDRFALGQSESGGAVCEAVRDDADQVVQRRGARAWAVRCRGWDVPLGRIYLFERRAAEAASEAHAAALAGRAACGAARAVPLPKADDATRADCKLRLGEVPYVAYAASHRGSAARAEGFPQIADVVEAGLRIALGIEAPPASVTSRLSASSRSQDFGAAGGLSAMAEAAAPPEVLRARAYSRNLDWRFDAAGTDFRDLAQDPRLPKSARAEAFLNWALNTSNSSRFAQADGLFAQAAEQLAGGDHPALSALTLSYQALHLRNQRRFSEAAETAAAARSRLEALLSQTSPSSGSALSAGDAVALVIGPDLAAALNWRAGGGQSDAATRLRVQIAQNLMTEATSRSALGEAGLARQVLQQANVMLTDSATGAAAPWLGAQVRAELARLDLAQGRPGEARERLQDALTVVRRHHGGTPVEAFLLVELAQAKARAGDVSGAMADYDSGFEIFRESRGSLGASANSAAPYFDLLLQEHEAAGAGRRGVAARFFRAASSVSHRSVSDTVTRLSARLSQGDGLAAGLARALEDTKRQVNVAQAALSALPPDVTPARRAEADDRVRTLALQAAEIEQRLLEVNPRYGQLVAADLDLDQLQKSLRPGELYLKTVLLADRGYGLAVTSETVTPYSVAVGSQDASRRVRLLRTPFETENRLPRFDVAEAADLFDDLFGPVRDQVLQAKHVIYEPDAVLVSLPLAALVVDKASVDLVNARLESIRAQGQGVLSYNGVAWLGATTDTSLTVSAASFVQSRSFAPSKASRTFLGFGGALQPARNDVRAFAGVSDPRLEGGVDVCAPARQALMALPPLPDALREIRAVGGILGAPSSAVVDSARFTDAAVRGRQDLDAYQVIYFATHGLLPQSGDCLPEPSLVTSVGGEGSDGLLDASEILNLKLDAELVVLSACDTGGAGSAEVDRTGLEGAGEALGGLARAFIYAGARGLVVSHWQVDSRATTQLMEGMFKAGGTQAGALRRSALQLMNDPGQFSHPYYWAAFNVVGDGGRSMPAPAGASAQAD